jgi:nitrite reductase/ring-hydroxylating ferredoxin subunit
MADDREYGMKLCDALMKIFGAGQHELPAIVEGLNQSDVAPPSGTRWTADRLCEELHRRARPPEKKTYSPVAQARNDQGNGGGEIAPSLPKPANAEERSEYLVRHGLRNQWYIAAASKEVTDKPLGITRLDERMVLWRDEQGEVQALADRCPHRGVALSAGEVHGGVIACAYHGVQVDGSGRVVKVPAVANCPLEGRRLVRSYPIIEHYQAIWAYFGDEKHPLPPPLELPEELTSPEWSGMLHPDIWNGHYQYVYDNLCDPMHGPYLHGRTYTQQYGPKDDKIKVERKERGFEVFREGQRGINFDWMEIVHGDSSHEADRSADARGARRAGSLRLHHRRRSAGRLLRGAPSGLNGHVAAAPTRGCLRQRDDGGRHRRNGGSLSRGRRRRRAVAAAHQRSVSGARSRH